MAVKAERPDGEFTMCTDYSVPLSWLPPETILSNQWSMASDTWSFGVLMWEIFTNGLEPYAFECCSEVEIARFIVGGKTLTPPPNCPILISSLMRDCWK